MFGSTAQKITLLVRPLQSEGRTRETIVETQLHALLCCRPPDFWLRVRLTDRSSTDWVQEETLVGLLRILNRCDKAEAAWDIAEILIRRTAGFLSKHIRAWRLSRQHEEDCIRDVQEQMILDLFNEESKAEFWEVRFWRCLKFRFLNQVTKYQKVADNEIYASSEDETADNLMNRLPDTKNLSPQMQAEIAEALALLPEKERTAFVLYYFQGWQQQEIAARLKTTDRTVRNMLERANHRLEQWRTAS